MSDTAPIVCREATDADVPGLLTVRNAIFPPVTAAQWRAEPNQTAAVALLDGEVVGAMPLSLRPFRLSYGVAAPSAWENAVGTRQDLRSRGIGSSMTECAAEFLRERADLLLVYRGGERSPGYRFYTSTHHSDLCYMRRYVNTEPAREAVGSVVQLPGEAMLEREAEFLGAFQAAWGGYGGYPDRREGYYRWALSALIYKCLPTQFELLCELDAEARVEGYALLGHRQAPQPEHNLTVLELCTPGNDLEMARRLLIAAGNLAAQRGLGLATGASVLSPYRESYLALGMEESHRWMMIMGILLRGPELFERWARAGNRNGLPPVRVWTPSTEVVLNPGRGPEVALEMKDRSLIRWLCGRIDLRSAIADERITHYGASFEPIADLIPFHKWAYHGVDYV